MLNAGKADANSAMRAVMEMEGLVKEEGMRNFLVLGGADGFKIILNANRFSRFISNPRKVLLHEVQHLVQNIESFARGSNPNISYQDFQTEHKRVKKEVELLRRRSDADAGVLEAAGRKLAAFDEVEFKSADKRIVQENAWLLLQNWCVFRASKNSHITHIYDIFLKQRVFAKNLASLSTCRILSGQGGIRTLGTVLPYTRFSNVEQWIVNY